MRSAVLALLSLVAGGCGRRIVPREPAPIRRPQRPVGVAPLGLAAATGAGETIILGVGGAGHGAALAFTPRAAGAEVWLVEGRGARRVSIVAPAPGATPARPGVAGLAAAPAPPAASPALAAAAVAAAQLLDMDPARVAPGLGAGAGASAPTVADAAALPVAIAASLLGDPILADRAVVARFASDGTLTPTLDPVAEVRGLLAAGVRRIALPPGLKVGRDASGAVVELEPLVAGQGGRVSWTADLAAAYGFLTGVAMPAADPVEPAAMALTAESNAALAAAYRVTMGSLAGVWVEVVDLAARASLGPRLAELAGVASRDAALAEERRVSGDPAAAYFLGLGAIEAARAATRVRAMAEAATVPAAGDLAVPPLEPPAAPAVGLALALNDATREVATTERARLAAAATATLPALQAELAALPATLSPHAARRRRADALVPTFWLDELARATEPPPLIEAPGGAAFRLPGERVAATTTALSAAALGLGPPAVASPLPAIAPGYDAARADAVADRLARLDPASGSLALAEEALDRALATRARVALGVVVDPISARPIDVARRPSLVALTAAAEVAARQHARTAEVASGRIPVLCRYHYQLAVALAAAGRTLEARAEFVAASSAARRAVLRALLAEPGATP